MRKSRSKIVSLMVAASMMFTTVFANTSFVNAADATWTASDLLDSSSKLTYVDGASKNADTRDTITSNTVSATNDLQGTVNPANPNVEAGADYTFNGGAGLKYIADANGTLTVNVSGGASGKYLWIANDTTGKMVSKTDTAELGMTSGSTAVDVAVEANNTYYIFVNGSRIKFYSVSFTAESTGDGDNTGDGGDDVATGGGVDVESSTETSSEDASEESSEEASEVSSEEASESTSEELVDPLPYFVADGASPNPVIGLPKAFDATEDVDITVNFAVSAVGGSGALFNFSTDGATAGSYADTELGVRVASSQGPVGIGKSSIVSTDTVALKVAPDTNTMNLKYERATGKATLTINGQAITADVTAAMSQVISGFKIQGKTGREVTIYMISCGSGDSAVTFGQAVDKVPSTDTEESTEESSEDSSEESSEAASEETTEAVTEKVIPDMGNYDPSASTPQVYAEVAGQTGETSVKTGDTITVDFKMSGNTGFTNYDVLFDFDPEVLEFVEAVTPTSFDGYVTYKIAGVIDAPAVVAATINDCANLTPSATDKGFTDTKADGATTAAKLGRIKVAAAFADNALASNDGILASITFKVIGTEGPGWARMMTADGVNGFVSVADSDGTNIGATFAGIKVTLASDEPSTEESSEVSSEDTTESTTETTTEKTETTTKKSSSGGGGGGGSSSNNAAKENNEKADANKKDTTAQVVGGNTTTGGTSTGGTITNVGAVDLNGITINPPALKNADGEIVAGSKLNNSSLVSTNKFTDISTRAWAQTAINKLASIGVINGVGGGKFAPDATSKRGDFMVMLTKVLGVTGTPQSSFADVPASKYYANAVNLAKDLGLANGVGNNMFNPEAPITRQDMMVLVAKALEVVGYDVTSTDDSVLDSYTDANKVAEYAKPYVAFLIDAGLVNGTSTTTIDPAANMTRAQMAVLMSNLYDLVADAVVEAQEDTTEEETESEEVTEESSEESSETEEETEEASEEETEEETEETTSEETTVEAE